MKLINIKKDQLELLDDNPRKASGKGGHEKLIKLIKEHGFQNPLQVWLPEPGGSYIILCGNHRYVAGVELGMEIFPCVEYKGTRPQALSRAISDNKSGEWTTWDGDKLKKMLEEIILDPDDDNDELTGFSIDELDQILRDPTGDSDKPSKEDVAPGVNNDINPITRPGDLWMLGPHRLLCGSATVQKDVDQLMSGKAPDMVFTDPPYGMNLDTNFATMSEASEKAGRRMINSAHSNNYNKVKGDNQDYDPGHLFEMFPIVKEMFLWGADYYAERIPSKNKGSWLIWDKRAGLEGVKFSLSEFETCWSKKKHAREMLRYRWFGAMGTEQREEDINKRVHPNQKPVKMFLFMIDKWSSVGHIVVDPYLGSGSTLIACEKLDRICYAMEIVPKYCDLVLRRWAAYTGQDPVRSDGKKWSELCPSG